MYIAGDDVVNTVICVGGYRSGVGRVDRGAGGNIVSSVGHGGCSGMGGNVVGDKVGGRLSGGGWSDGHCMGGVGVVEVGRTNGDNGTKCWANVGGADGRVGCRCLVGWTHGANWTKWWANDGGADGG